MKHLAELTLENFPHTLCAMPLSWNEICHNTSKFSNESKGVRFGHPVFWGIKRGVARPVPPAPIVFDDQLLHGLGRLE